MSNLSSIRRLLKQMHHDQRGAVSLETILIIGAIALPILIFIIKYGWPRIRDLFYRGVEDIEAEAESVKQGG